MKNFIEQEFQKIYKQPADKVFFAPARVNLIGEHIDYNGGLVMPCALENGTYLAIRKTNDNCFVFRSLNFPEIVEKIEINPKGYQKKDNLWINYPLGCIDYFTREGAEFSGLEFLFYGNIPNGAGLSSSASIELVTSFALNSLFQFNKNQIELVKISQKVENYFVGMNCGIMDQFAIGMGKKNHAIILNCQMLDYQYIPFLLKSHTLLIINTLTDEMQKRVKHVVYENHRVFESEKALKNNDIEKFGALMSASHKSLMEDYEVTGKELDTIYLESIDYEGVAGVRMTGAGFGGCAIALVQNDKVESYKAHITQKYTSIIGYAPTIYYASVGDGTRELL